MIRSIVKENEPLREAIKSRLKELNWTQQDLADEAAKLGYPEIRRQSISRYMNRNFNPGVLNDPQILFIAAMLCIPVELVVGASKRPVLYKIPKYSKKLSQQSIREYEKQTNTQGEDTQGT